MVGTSNKSVPKMAIDRMPVWVHNHHNPTLNRLSEKSLENDHDTYFYLVGGAITTLKNMSSSMGRMTSHIALWKIKTMFETTNQVSMRIHVYPLVSHNFHQFSLSK